MLLTPHAMVGAAIGASTDNLTYIIILAMLSHFILDAIPHFDWGTWHDGEKDFVLQKKDYILVGTDAAILLILTYYLWHNGMDSIYMYIGMFFAILIDLIFNVPFWKKYTINAPVLRHIQILHEAIHFRLNRKYWYFGVITQIIVIIVSVIYILK